MSSSPSSEREKVGMIVPPPILLVALAVTAAIVQSLWFYWNWDSPVRVVFGVLIALCSLSLVAISAKQFRMAGTPVQPTTPALAIVESGSYKVTRNPMYIGMTGLLLSVALAGMSFAFVAAAVIFCAVVNFGVIVPEERYLERLHGRTYLEYKRRVRRWL